MTKTQVTCPYCESDYFNYVEERVVEKVNLYLEDGVLKKFENSPRVSIKTPTITVVCRNCGGEYTDCELAEIIAENIAD